MDKYDPDNGGYPGQVQFGRNMNDQLKQENEGEESNPAAQKAGEYVRELLQEKLSLDQNKHPNATRLVDQGNLKKTANSRFEVTLIFFRD